MYSPNQYLNELYKNISVHSPEMISENVPADIGRGRIYQTKTKQGVAVSDWQMEYYSDMKVQGISGSGYMQMIFCLNEGVSWEIEGQSHLIELSKGESSFSRCTDTPEYICYKKGKDFRFKSVKIPVSYWDKIAGEYFEHNEKDMFERRLEVGLSKTAITTRMEKILLEISDAGHYKGGLGFLYLESKTLELISVYFSELLGLTNAQNNISLSVTDRDALIEAKRIIDSRISSVPSCGALAKQVSLNTTKFTKGFVTMYGMPVHTYVIDKRLEKAAALLMEQRFNVGQVAMLVGYSNASHFAAAFKRKYGISPKRYKGA